MQPYSIQGGDAAAGVVPAGRSLPLATLACIAHVAVRAHRMASLH